MVCDHVGALRRFLSAASLAKLSMCQPPRELNPDEHEQKLKTSKLPPKRHGWVAIGCTKKKPKPPIFKFADLRMIPAIFGRFRPNYCHFSRVVRVVRVKMQVVSGTVHLLRQRCVGTTSLGRLVGAAVLATAVRQGSLGGAAPPRRPCTRPCRVRRAELHQQVSPDRFHHGGHLGHVGTVTLPPFRQRLWHTADYEPASDRDDSVVAETFSGDMASLTSRLPLSNRARRS